MPVRTSAAGRAARIITNGLQEAARRHPRRHPPGEAKAPLPGPMKQAPAERASAQGLRLVILRSLFNRTISDGLVDGARQALAEMGAVPARVAVFDVPGAFELPVAARAAALSGRFDAVIALGAVIRGETDHYEHVSREAAAGLATV